MSYNSSLDDLGDMIESIIDRAVNSQDFQQLNQTIRQALNTAVDTGSDAVRRAMEEAARKNTSKRKIVEERRSDQPLHMSGNGDRPRGAARPNVNAYSSNLGTSHTSASQSSAPVPALYQNTGGRMAGGILKTVGGGVLSLIGGGGTIASGVVTAVIGLGGVLNVLGGLSLGLLGAGIGLLVSGIRSITRVNRFGKYRQTLGSRTRCELSQLARRVGKSPKFVRKELKKMIDDGYFLEGHLDEEEQNLITSDDEYVKYLESRQKEAVAQRQQVTETRREQEEADREKHSAQVQEVLDKGGEFIRQLRQCNDRIPGQEVSDKISRMEQLVSNIFERVKTDPEVVPELKKLMDYYLPMAIKLLNAYADMDAMAVQGENIQSSKREIEDTLDTLNTAFEKLLDSIFKTTALDLSSDITVLHTLLAQEGLTEDELTRLRREKE